MTPKPRLAILGVAAAFATLALVWILALPHASKGLEFGEPFKLLAARTGVVVDSKALLGKPYGMFFGYTHCPEVCPTTLSDMTIAYGELGDKAKDFRMFFVSVDPERDTAPVMKDYLSSFDNRIEALIPTPEELPQLAKAFHIYYKKIPGDDEDYTMDHTATVYLFDARGKLKSTISYDETKSSKLAKLQKLLAAN